MFWHKTLSPLALLQQVGLGRQPRVIDFRGNYTVSVPTAIPVQFDPDFFYEEEGWVQDMLGVPFRPEQPVVLICEHGHSAQLAQEYFYDKNNRSRFRLLVLKGGWHAYLLELDRLTDGYKRKPQLMAELTDLATTQARFAHLAKGLTAQARVTWLGIPLWRR